jgi:chitinase
VCSHLLLLSAVAPWFEKGYAGGGYLAVNSAVGSLIDWYNIQFYNQGTAQYTTCATLLTTSGGSFPGSSVFEIAANGVPLSKLVIGKPANSGDGPSGGYVDPATLATCVSQAKASGWNAGVMAWEVRIVLLPHERGAVLTRRQYPDSDSAWIKTVRGSAFP